MALLEHLKNRIIGASVIECRLDDAAGLLDVCLREHVPYSKMRQKDDKIYLYMSRPSARRLCVFLSRDGIEFTQKTKGIPVFLEKYRRRYGLMAGGVIIAALVLISSQVVWDVRVTGNTTLTVADVRNELASVGFSVGSKIGKRDTDEIANAVLAKSEKIAWLAINMSGNVALVQIREKTFSGADGEINSPANVVASCDGVIERLEIKRGTPAVKVGDAVREGELLISGLTELKYGGYRTEKAIGDVYAVTVHRFRVEIPFEYEKKIVSEPVCSEKNINFFSKKINIYRKSGNSGEFCDKIEKEKCFSLFGLAPLPVSICSVYTVAGKTEPHTRNADEASELAFFELRNRIENSLGGADLLEKKISTEITETALVLTCCVTCSENIAKSVPFNVGT